MSLRPAQRPPVLTIVTKHCLLLQTYDLRSHELLVPTPARVVPLAAAEAAVRRRGAQDDSGAAAGQRLTGGLKIGPRLRSARKLRGMSLDDVALSTGLTKGFLSQLERDRVSASVASLLRVCDALGIRIGSLFETSRADLVRHDERQPINFGGEGVSEHLLTPGGDRRIQVIQSEIAPGGGAGEEQYALSGDAEFVHVLRGVLELVVQGDTYLLGPGDSMTFSPRDPHTWRNKSTDEDALVLWVLTPSPW
jgi:transcriptional regulator with XRE-family HTH domain